MINRYFRGLYKRTMAEAYNLAAQEIIKALVNNDGLCLDCGANEGYWFERLSTEIGLTANRYQGIEWNMNCVSRAQQKHINVQHGDLNQGIPVENDTLQCVFALSLLEHLLNGCRFLRDAHRTLKPGGKLILLTPNISTYFTAALILAGRMPSSGPHPDSNALLKSEEIFQLSSENPQWDTESESPSHRHLVVFSYLTLKKYLNILGFSTIQGYGFGLYPLPNFMQPIAEKVDPYHCHQMVFIAEK